MTPQKPSRSSCWPTIFSGLQTAARRLRHDRPAPCDHRTGRLLAPVGTYVVPSLIADLAEQANSRYVEFFAANINNDHTRRAYARACSRFFAWCEDHGLTITSFRPFDVAAWVKQLQEKHGRQASSSSLRPCACCSTGW